MSLLRKKKLAELADRHDLYQRSVQDTESEIDFIEQTWGALRDRPAEILREDFCGTAKTACEWVQRDVRHYAIGIDLDEEAPLPAELSKGTRSYRQVREEAKS